MIPAPHTLREVLSLTIQDVILRGAFSQAEIARRLRKARSTVSGWVNRAELPGPDALLGLSLMHSELDDNRLADLFSSDAFQNQIIQVSPGWSPNGTYLDEMDRAVRAIGLASDHSNKGDALRANALIDKAITSLIEWKLENTADAPTAPLAASGDGLSEPRLRLVSLKTTTPKQPPFFANDSISDTGQTVEVITRKGPRTLSVKDALKVIEREEALKRFGSLRINHPDFTPNPFG